MAELTVVKKAMGGKNSGELLSGASFYVGIEKDGELVWKSETLRDENEAFNR